MRITGGILKNRHIECPKGIIRPAMDRMRESLFSILGDLGGLAFLDMFSGSGICALEAYSRGAYPVCCVEKDPIKFPVLLSNAAIADKRLDCKKMSVELFIRRTKSSFDIVYIDPPFPYRFHTELLDSLQKSSVLKSGGIVLIHRPKEKELPPAIGALQRFNIKIYGRSVVDFYKKNQPEEIQNQQPREFPF